MINICMNELTAASYLYTCKDAKLICRRIEYLLSQYAETLALMLSVICAVK